MACTLRAGASIVCQLEPCMQGGRGVQTELLAVHAAASRRCMLTLCQGCLRISQHGSYRSKGRDRSVVLPRCTIIVSGIPSHVYSCVACVARCRATPRRWPR